MPTTARRIARQAIDLIDRGVSGVVVVTMCGMTAVVFTQVVLRYGFNSSLDWADEVARLLFVWSMFLALPLGVKSGAHIGVELVVAKLPALPRAVLARSTAGLAAFLMAIVCWRAALLAAEQWDERLPTIALPVGLFMVPICIGAGHSVLHLLAVLVRGAAPRTAAYAE